MIFAVVVLLCDLIPKLLALSAPYRLSTIGAFTLQASVRLLDRFGSALENASTAIVVGPIALVRGLGECIILLLEARGVTLRSTRRLAHSLLPCGRMLITETLN